MNVNWKKVGAKVGGVTIGTLGAKIILKTLPATITDLYKGIGCLIAGALLPNFVKGEFMDAIGSGIISVGAEKLATNFGFAISGVEDEGYSVSARNMAIEQANQQVSEYISAVNELEYEVAGLAEEGAMVASIDGPEDENMVAEDLAYAM